MKTTTTMPTEGQFIAIWQYNNKLWSETLRWNGLKLLHYIGGDECPHCEMELDDWEETLAPDWYREHCSLFVQ